MRVRLCDPVDYSLPDPCVHGIFRARKWRGLRCPPPADLPDPGTKPASPVASASLNHLGSPHAVGADGHLLPCDGAMGKRVANFLGHIFSLFYWTLKLHIKWDPGLSRFKLQILLTKEGGTRPQRGAPIWGPLLGMLEAAAPTLTLTFILFSKFITSSV